MGPDTLLRTRLGCMRQGRKLERGKLILGCSRPSLFAVNVSYDLCNEGRKMQDKQKIQAGYMLGNMITNRCSAYLSWKLCWLVGRARRGRRMAGVEVTDHSLKNCSGRVAILPATNLNLLGYSETYRAEKRSQIKFQ